MNIINKAWQAAFIAVLSFPMLSGCSNRDDHDHPSLKTGEALFNHHCAECHSEDGTGKLADRTPANILTRKSRQGIVNYVTRGSNPERKMPVFSSMSRSEAGKIASHLLQLRNAYNNSPNNKKKPRQLLIEP